MYHIRELFFFFIFISKFKIKILFLFQNSRLKFFWYIDNALDLINKRALVSHISTYLCYLIKFFFFFGYRITRLHHNNNTKYYSPTIHRRPSACKGSSLLYLVELYISLSGTMRTRSKTFYVETQCMCVPSWCDKEKTEKVKKLRELSRRMRVAWILKKNKRHAFLFTRRTYRIVEQIYGEEKLNFSYLFRSCLFYFLFFIFFIRR